MPNVGLLPALALILGVIAGILAGTASDIVGDPGSAVVHRVASGVAMAMPDAAPRLLPSCLTALLAASVVCWWRRRSLLVVAAVVCGFAAGGASLGAAAAERARDTALRQLLDDRFGGFDIDTLGPEGPHDPVPARFTLLEDAVPSGTGIGLRASVQAVRLDGTWRGVGAAGMRLTVGGAPGPSMVGAWRAGRTYRAPVVFRRPARYLNVGVPDFEQDLAFDGITLLGTVKSGLLLVEERQGSRASELAASARAFIRAAVATHVSTRDPVAGAIVIAVLVGDRAGLSDDLRERLQAAGTYHVIAISGGNIAVLTGLALTILAVVGMRGPPAAVATIAVLGAYAWSVVSGPSVWRATAVAVGYLVATLGDHRTPPWQAMALAAALMVAIDPLDVRNPGFILTFGASAALLELARRLQLGVERRGLTVTALVATSLAASMAVELALLPVSAQLFSRVSMAGLLLNLIAVPAMVVVQVSGMAVVGLSWWATAAHGAGTVAIWAAWALGESGRLVELAPWLSHRVPPPGLAVIAAYYTSLLALVWIEGRRRVLPGAILAGCLVLIVAGPVQRWWGSEDGDGTLHLTMIDVGQAESIVVRTAGEEPLMIDTGGAAFGGFDVGARVLAPALWASGIYSLGALLVTHGDPDHIGGALRVVDDFSPTAVWGGVPMPTHAPSIALADAARREGSAIVARRRGQTWRWGVATVRVLHPPEPDWERRRVRNDDSVVLEILHGDVAILLTGDIGADVEREILPLLTPARVRILKVAHHGSRTSSSRELIEGWRPTIALISCGRGNQYGHPVREVLERLEDVGARVYRTDRDGQIAVVTDGGGVDVTTYVAGRERR